MIQKIKNSLVVMATLVSFGLPALVPVTVHAAADIGGGLCQGGENIQISDTAGTCTEPAGGGINALLTKIVNIFSAIVGVIAVIMIIVGGFKYITSGGDSGNVSAAKNTIIYAIVGLVIVALAQIIVRFVLVQSQAATA